MGEGIPCWLNQYAVAEGSPTSKRGTPSRWRPPPPRAPAATGPIPRRFGAIRAFWERLPVVFATTEGVWVIENGRTRRAGTDLWGLPVELPRRCSSPAVPDDFTHGSEVEPPVISPNIPDSAGVGYMSDHVAAQAFTLDAGQGFQRTRHEPTPTAAAIVS
jgi:hypothetical protein